jgi:O-antigen ligase
MILLVAIISPSVVAENASYSYVRLGMIFPLLIAGFGAALWLPTLPKVEWVRIVTAFGLGMLLFVCVIFPKIPDFINVSDLGWSTGIVPFYNIRRFTHVVIIAICAGTGLWLWSVDDGDKQNNRIVQSLVLIGLCFGWTVIYWAGSRAPILAYALTMLVLLSVTHQKRVGLLIGWLGPNAFGLCVSTLLPCPQSNVGIKCRIETATTQDQSLNQLSSGRITIWQETFERFLAKPILGHGHGQFPVVSDAGFETPHNFILEMLFDFGLLGGVPVLLLFYGGILRLLQIVYYQGLNTYSAIGLIVVLHMSFQTLLDGMVTDSYLMVLCGMFYAMAWAGCKLRTQNNN